MRFDPNKFYTYPVLRPSSTDYQQAAFEVEIQPDRIRGTTSLRVTADFFLSDPDLQTLLTEGRAAFVLRIHSIGSHHRSAYMTRDSQVSRTFADGQLHGRTELWGFLIAMQDLPNFRAERWHADYGSMSFDIHAGAVLAADEPKEYWIDTAEEALIGSIFELQENSRLAAGSWEVQLDDDKVVLHMSMRDYQRFCQARSRVNGTTDAAYIMNSVYLPALIWTLQVADVDSDSYSDNRWYRSLNSRLSDCECMPLGSTAESRLMDAQKLLDNPFANLPLMTSES